MTERLTVVGGTVAALVAADEAARLGADVDLLVPGGRLGAGFADLVVEDRRLRLGSRLLELAYDQVDPSAPPLERYLPGPAGHAPFMALLRDWVLDLLDGEVTEVAHPTISIGGRVGPDVHMTADLRHLPALVDDATLGRIAAEAHDAEVRTGPAGVLDDPARDPWQLPLAEASIHNHGATFHRLLVEPVAAKIIAGGSAHIATALRRKSWLALFHPRTLREAASGEPVGYRPSRRFHVDETGGTGAVLEALVARVRSRPGLTVRAVGRLQALRGTELAFDDGSSATGSRAIAAIPPAELFAAAGVAFTEERFEVGLSWAEVASDDVLERPSAVLLADPDLPAYRVGPGGRGSDGRELFVIEHAADADDLDPACALARAGIIEAGSSAPVVHRLRAPAGPRPSPDAAAAFAAAAAAFADRAPGVHRVGSAAAYGADSFNEQVVAGLHAARALAA